MALAHGLMTLAEELADPKKAKKGRPPQAVLRRAVSTAYYALFHRLIERATDQLAGVKASDGVRGVIARAFAHGQMKDLSKQLAQGKVPRALRPAVPAVPTDLRMVARSFASLQEERHRADYDLTRPYTKAEAVASIASAKRAIAQLDAPSPSVELKTFLLLLPLWQEVKRH